MEIVVGITLKITLIMGVIAGFGLPFLPMAARAADVSPTLLIETGPSDKPAYRRMISIKYLRGNSVTANYKAYNRREFINTPNTTPATVIAACASGRATSLGDIKSFEKDETRRMRNGQAPIARTFCIKNISNWQAKNKDRYLDPIFESMPYLAK